MSTAPSPTAARLSQSLPVLRLEAALGEQQRALTDAAHQALVDAGVFNLSRPKSLGGDECDLLTFVRTVKEVSRADGSAGWCAMISGCYQTFGALLPPAGAREVFSQPATILAGALSPSGMAQKVEGGYRISGRWPFGSNSPHASWMVGGAVVFDNGAPVMFNEKRPKIVLGFFPKQDVTIIDTWTTTGLRATGSHDYAVNDLFVPEERTFWFSDQPHEAGALYQLPAIASYGAGIAAVTVGIAWHALDAFKALAPNKTPILSPLTLDHKPNVHDRIGMILANVEAADAYLERVVTDSMAIVEAGGHLDWEQRGRLWLGGTHAAQMAMNAIEDLYTMAGASAVYATNDLDRCLRDARTAVQHVMTQFVNYEIAGRQFLGHDIRDTIWAMDDRAGA